MVFRVVFFLFVILFCQSLILKSMQLQQKITSAIEDEKTSEAFTLIDLLIEKHGVGMKINKYHPQFKQASSKKESIFNLLSALEYITDEYSYDLNARVALKLGIVLFMVFDGIERACKLQKTLCSCNDHECSYVHKNDVLKLSEILPRIKIGIDRWIDEYKQRMANDYEKNEAIEFKKKIERRKIVFTKLSEKIQKTFLTIEKRLPWFNRYENFIKKVSAVFFISLVASYAIMPTIANQQKTTICNKEYVDSKNNTDKDDVGFNLTNNYAIANYDENIALECNKCLQGNKNVDNQALPRCDVCQMVANYYEDTSGNLECRRCTQGEQQMLALQDQDNDRQAEYVCLVCKEKRTDAEEVEM